MGYLVNFFFFLGLLSLSVGGGCFVLQTNGSVYKEMGGTFNAPCSVCEGSKRVALESENATQ